MSNLFSGELEFGISEEPAHNRSRIRLPGMGKRNFKHVVKYQIRGFRISTPSQNPTTCFFFTSIRRSEDFNSQSYFNHVVSACCSTRVPNTFFEHVVFLYLDSQIRVSVWPATTVTPAPSRISSRLWDNVTDVGDSGNGTMDYLKRSRFRSYILQ